jgi:hypothetical protein
VVEDMLVTFEKHVLSHNDFEVFTIKCNSQSVGNFIHDKRSNYNSVLLLNREMYFNGHILYYVSKAVIQEFIDVEFKVGID